MGALRGNKFYLTELKFIKLTIATFIFAKAKTKRAMLICFF